MCWLVVVQHQPHDVPLAAEEDDLEHGIVERLGFVEGPEEIEVSRYVDNQVQELRFKAYAGCALLEC